MHYGNPNLTSMSNGPNTFIQWHGTATSTFIDTLVKGQPLISEHRARVTSSSHDTRWGVSTNSTLSYPLYAATVNPVSPNSRYFICYDNYTTISIGIYETPTFTVNQYYRIKVVLTATELHAYVDDNEISTGFTSSALTGHNMGLFMTVTTGTAEQEWSFIRQYAAIEPTFTMGAAEAMNSFTRRKTITINNNSGAALTDYQIPVTVAYESAMQPDFDDIRFVDINGNLLPCWLESKTDSSTAKFWIKVNLPIYGTPSPTGDNTVYMYYGNANLTNASDGINTFPSFFDDFSGDLSKWTINAGSWGISQGSLRKLGSGASYADISALSTTAYGIWEWKARYPNQTLGEGLFKIMSSGQTTSNSFNNNQYGLRQSSSAYLDLRKDVGGTAIIIDSSWTPDANWHNFKVTRNNSGLFELFFDGISKGTGTDNTIISTTMLGIYVETSSDQRDFDDIRIRKYASPEPTVSISAEESPTNVTATSMTIIPSETPCRIGICTVQVRVTWRNDGGTGMFTPTIIIDSTPYSLDSESLGADASVQKTFTVSGLSTGTHAICPSPN